MYDPPPGYKDDLIVWDFIWMRISSWDARAALVSSQPAQTAFAGRIGITAQRGGVLCVTCHAQHRTPMHWLACCGVPHSVTAAAGRCPPTTLHPTTTKPPPPAPLPVHCAVAQRIVVTRRLPVIVETGSDFGGESARARKSKPLNLYPSCSGTREVLRSYLSNSGSAA